MGLFTFGCIKADFWKHFLLNCYTQIEEQLKTLRKVEQKQQQKQQQPQQLQQQQQQLPPVSSAEATEKGATMPFTPQQEATYDPNVYLQVKLQIALPVAT